MGDLLVHHAQNDIQIRLLKPAGVQANLTMYELAKSLSSVSTCSWMSGCTCLELVDWTTGLEYWIGILEWPKLL